MKWHEYETPHQRTRHLSPSVPESKWFDVVCSQYDAGQMDVFSYRHCQGSVLWNADKRPYYNVYPSVAVSLSRTSLDLPCHAITDSLQRLPARLSVRYQVGGELRAGRSQIADIFYSYSNITLDGDAPQGNGIISLWVCDKADAAKPKVYSHFTVPLLNGETVEEGIERLGLNCDKHGFDRRKGTVALRTVVCLALLHSDPEIISPVVLNAHREKFEKTGDPKYIEKAAKRGVVGWEVGRDIEVGPHYRRPHFGIRWTGKGAKEPKLVPVKGSIVHRKKVGEVPTGYLGQYA